MADKEKLAQLVQQLWAANGHVARGRVALLVQYVDDLEGGGPVTQDQTDAAVWSAHNLRGALGSYQRPGSEQAAELEALLGDGAPTPRMRELLAVLAEAVSDEPVVGPTPLAPGRTGP